MTRRLLAHVLDDSVLAIFGKEHSYLIVRRIHRIHTDFCLDFVSGRDRRNPPPRRCDVREARLYRFILYAARPRSRSPCMGPVIAGRGELPPVQTLGLMLSVGLYRSARYYFAHELATRVSKFDQLWQRIADVSVLRPLLH